MTDLVSALAAVVGRERTLTRPIDLIARAADASFYRLIPQAVVEPRGVAEIQALFRLSHERRLPITFRAAGTSVSGQAVTEGLLVDISRHWRTVTVEDGGRGVRVQPGVMGGHVNARLKPYGAKIGPDPASIGTCMMGGILANNSSGMCCGVVQNAYHTLSSLSFVLPSGTVIDSASADADRELLEREPALHAGMLALRREVHADEALAARIRAKYRMKNTVGYSLNAFVDFERPIDILSHLLIGSEGTLAFIAEAVMNTVPDLEVKHTGLLLFGDLYAAADAIAPLRDAGAAALELMDRASLRCVETQAGMPPSIRALPDSGAAILAEFQAADPSERPTLEKKAADACARLQLLEPAHFTADATEQALLWRIRKGLFPSVGARRPRGTTVISEDVAFPVERLADAALDLTRLFQKHGYPDGIVFGHAKDGNLHFVITHKFGDLAAIERYARLMEDVVELVVHRYDGALKAEHGTGRNMAPFVESEWGREAYAVMKRLKALCDPTGLLNPGVILNDDPRVHLKNLKPYPEIEPEVDKCIECGYCESRCPSLDLTLTPRQRIVVRREQAQLRANGGDLALLASLDADARYASLDTCAVDGLCATDCPVSINTGELVKRLRGAAHSPMSQRLAESVAHDYALAEGGARLALRLGHAAAAVIGTSGMTTLTRLTSATLQRRSWQWSAEMPRPARPLPATPREAAAAVYFPSCVTRVFGPLPGEPESPSLAEAFVSVASRAGRPLWIPENVAGVCCGVPFSSKGYEAGHRLAVNRAVERFWSWSGSGRLPVVIDTSPCTYGVLTSGEALTPENRDRLSRLQVKDAAVFAHDSLLPNLKVSCRRASVALHPVCSAQKLGISGTLDALARACSERVTVPFHAGCCGFAGDRGFLFPELTASAMAREANDLRDLALDGCYATSRTCEIGLTRATGRPWRSLIHLLEKATRSGPVPASR